jgi:hypothetical protein
LSKKFRKNQAKVCQFFLKKSSKSLSKEFQKKIRIKFVKKIQKKQSLSKKFRNIKSSKSLSQFFLKNRGNVCQKKFQKPVEKFFFRKVRNKNSTKKSNREKTYEEQIANGGLHGPRAPCRAGGALELLGQRRCFSRRPWASTRVRNRKACSTPRYRSRRSSLGEVAAAAAGDQATTAGGDAVWVLTHPTRSVRPSLGGGSG